MGLVLLILCLFLVFGGLPMAPWGGWHSMGWGVSGVGLIVLVILVVVLFSGRL